MGRTLYYGINGTVNFSDKQHQALLDLQIKYNKEYEWQCESILLSVFMDIPKRNAKISTIGRNQEDGNDSFEVEMIELERIDENEPVEYEPKDKLYGFTKVNDNEPNAHLVIDFVADASRIISEREWYLYDEGNALYCEVLVKNGLARPSLEHVSKTIKYWEDKIFVNKEIETNQEMLDYYRKVSEKNWQWMHIEQFVRPLAEPRKADFNEILETTNMERFIKLKKEYQDIIINANLEHVNYYDDVNSYPDIV